MNAIASSQKQTQQEIAAYIAAELADCLLNFCSTYEEVMEAVAVFPEYKAAAWALLTREQKLRIHVMKEEWEANETF